MGCDPAYEARRLGFESWYPGMVCTYVCHKIENEKGWYNENTRLLRNVAI